MRIEKGQWSMHMGLRTWNHMTWDCLTWLHILSWPTPHPLAVWVQSNIPFLTLTCYTAILPHSVQALDVSQGGLKSGAHSWHKPGSHHPTAVGLQHKPWTQQVQASHSPPVQAWWVPVWRLWSQGIAYLPLREGEAEEMGRAWLSFLSPISTWNIVSVIGGRQRLAVRGPLSHRAGSPVPLLISPCPRE